MRRTKAPPSPPRLPEADALAAYCHECFVNPGEPCTNYKGQAKAPCRNRGQVTTPKAATLERGLFDPPEESAREVPQDTAAAEVLGAAPTLAARVLGAMHLARTRSDDWQAELCEILLIPEVAEAWRRLNPRFSGLAIRRINGKPHVRYTPEENRQVGERREWAAYCGFVLELFTLGDHAHTWNAVRDDWYGHCAGTCWNGVRRETVCQFVEDLRNLALGHDHEESRVRILAAGLEWA